MKRFLMCLFGCLIFAMPVFAGVDNRTIIAETQLDDDPVAITGTWNIADYKKVAVWIDYSEVEVGGGLSVAVTVDYSYDNTTFVSGYFYDFAGGSTLQTTETISADGWYYLWLDTDWQIPYIRVTLTATGSDVDDIATVIAYLVGQK